MQNESLKALYPGFSEEECREAVDNLDRYLALAWEIYEEMQSGKSTLDAENAEP